MLQFKELYALHRSSNDIKSDLQRLLPTVREWIGEQRLSDIRQISMLDHDALAMLALAASHAQGPILEIGPYIGGSTTALCIGAEVAGVPVFVIEVGGAYPNQPYLPSNDIIGDLRKNLARFGFGNAVEILQGWSHQRTLYRRVERLRRHAPLGLISIDADGQIASTLGMYADQMRPDCLVIVDDYVAPGAKSKQDMIAPWIDAQVRSGVLREFGVFGSGTWFGQINGPESSRLLSRTRMRFLHEEGHCFMVFLATPEQPDSLLDMEASSLVLHEDGIPLAHPHSLHKAIRQFGRGRYSHWTPSNQRDRDGYGGMLLFSSSDQTNPNDNGREYSVSRGEVLVPVHEL